MSRRSRHRSQRPAIGFWTLLYRSFGWIVVLIALFMVGSILWAVLKEVYRNLLAG